MPSVEPTARCPLARGTRQRIQRRRTTQTASSDAVWSLDVAASDKHKSIVGTFRGTPSPVQDRDPSHIDACVADLAPSAKNRRKDPSLRFVVRTACTQQLPRKVLYRIVLAALVYRRLALWSALWPRYCLVMRRMSLIVLISKCFKFRKSFLEDRNVDPPPVFPRFCV